MLLIQSLGASPSTLLLFFGVLTVSIVVAAVALLEDY